MFALEKLKPISRAIARRVVLAPAVRALGSLDRLGPATIAKNNGIDSEVPATGASLVIWSGFIRMEILTTMVRAAQLERRTARARGECELFALVRDAVNSTHLLWSAHARSGSRELVPLLRSLLQTARSNPDAVDSDPLVALLERAYRNLLALGWKPVDPDLALDAPT